jgi:glycosyltransferase involved in cell wall biosynthesis
MNVLFWHVHGTYTEAFVSGPHTYVLPVTQPRDTWGLGLPPDVDWPAGAREVSVEEVSDASIDVVVAQRPEEITLARRWLGQRPGIDIPLVYLEHNTPGGSVPFTRHPMADRHDCLLVHVTQFNALMWDTGHTETVVVRHGLPDPGQRWSPAERRLAAVINEPVRRGRAVGTDLLPSFAGAVGVDLFGMKVSGAAEQLGCDPRRLRCHEDLPRRHLHDRMCRLGAYLHVNRWTSLGLSLVEAMFLGMPVVVLATTEAPAVVPPEAGALSSHPAELLDAARRLLADPRRAEDAGEIARQSAVDRFGLSRFIDDWNSLLEEALAS